MESIKIGELKVNNVNKVNPVEMPSNQLKIEGKAENTSKDTKETKKESGVTKHVVTYIGNSEFVDSTKCKWHHNDEVTISDEEFENREDLHFMIRYGEMKHTVVTM